MAEDIEKNQEVSFEENEVQGEEPVSEALENNSVFASKQNPAQPKENWHKLFEAALFMSPNALAIEDLMAIVGSENYTEVKNFALDFLKQFNEKDSALEILQVDDAFKMQVKAHLEPLVSGFAAKSLFHQGMMKTLALIAFKQPIMQNAVIKYRNNKAYDHISRLVEEGFVAREQKGRSFVLRTTKKFLEYFGTDFKKEQKTL
ncbi:MAG: SMC-Scp complex subunit ScpB [Candidatus ainarchaeum sp.]|nr:SMC-Scp complex subunit ScpB [Candidatus ainarchaeum sp.]